MAQNFIQRGEVISYTNTGDTPVKSGDLVILGALAGVATMTIAPEESGSVNLTGVWDLPKKADEAVDQGVSLYWDADEKALTTTESGISVGCAFRAAAAEATSVHLRLNR